ncbi:MAG TPA: hypothetical protein VKU00_10850 [Chthonomonadaceae bacterium]|nr:hypothetical protein [Chthonomonadaceae bacterium]
MGWNLLQFDKLKNLCRIALVCALLILAGMGAHAQLIIDPDSPPTPADAETDIGNQYLQLAVGVGTNKCGAFYLGTAPTNPIDPFNILMEGWNLKSLLPKETEPPYVPYKGGWVYMKVDGGSDMGNVGQYYLWGDTNTYGRWILAPSIVGNFLRARWETVLAEVGGKGIPAANPQIEVDLTASFVHDTARFQFDIKNTDTIQHSVGLCFVQDIDVQTTGIILDGPLRLPNQPYLHHEIMLNAGQIPQKWESYSLIQAASGNTPAQYHTIRGTLQPPSGNINEPTAPTRFLYGIISQAPNIEGFDLSTGTKRRTLAITWEYEQYLDPTNYFDRANVDNGGDAGTVVYWDPQVIPNGATRTIVTYLGTASSETDYRFPMSLSVSAPRSLGFVTDRTNPNSPVANVAPNPFTVNAFVQNLSDLNLNPITSIGPINLSIILPKGLKLAPNETANKSIPDAAPGSEVAASWQIMTDAANPVSGPVTFTVSAVPKVGNGKVVPFTIEIPTPPTITLKSNKVTDGLFEMKSFPLNFAGNTPSQVLGLPIPNPANGISPEIDVLQWDPLSAHYVSQNTWIPGFGYWVRYNPPDTTVTTTSFPINAAKYPPLDGSTAPTTSDYRVTYPQGWNQIGDPYIYEYTFSETQVFDNDTLDIQDLPTAADPSHLWVLPAVYSYDSSDPDPTQWQYRLFDNFGFQMIPGQSYWIRVNKPNLLFIYRGSDSIGASVGRAALIGVGMGSGLGRGTLNNWRLQLNAKGATSKDSLAYIGVAPQATDRSDTFKLPKPPTMNPSVSLNIVHTDWNANNGNYAQDLRSAAAGAKTWNLTLTSPKPNEQVTVTWPSIASSVPKDYYLTLIDTDTNERHDLRTTSSYVVNTGPSSTRHFQIEAFQRSAATTVAIMSFDVVPNSGGKGATGVRSVAIHYTLSNMADTHINIRDGQGRTIRTLTTTTTRSATNGGVGDTVWDIKDQKGVNLPGGVYNAELVAVGTNGQTSRQVKPIIITGR